MNKTIRRVATAAGVLLVVLLLNLTVVQAVRGPSLRANPRNFARTQMMEFTQQRGQITADGLVLAASRQIDSNSNKYQRYYSGNPEMWAPVTGYYSLYSRTGIEYSEDSILSGMDDKLFGTRIVDLFTGRDRRGGNVILTLQPKLQRAAWRSLQKGVGAGPLVGGVVAIQPSTGAILALASSPSFDPTLFASYDNNVVNATDEALRNAKDQPLLNRATNNPLPPGSTFKVITTAALLQKGVTPDTPVNQNARTILPDTVTPLENYGGQYCGGGTFEMAFAYSCNVPFAELSTRLTIRDFERVSKAFGIGEVYENLGASNTASTIGDIRDSAALAQSSIGQRDVSLTPLQNAVIAATIANNGVRMDPYMVAAETAQDLTVLYEAKPKELNRAISPAVARQLTDLMITAEKYAGGGGKLDIPVASKTGTAEHGTDSSKSVPYTWYIAFVPGYDVAVAVMVEKGPGVSRGAVGATVAGPIGRAVLKAAVAEGARR
ncbi:MAG TPA: penicillin-binding protein 2 [Corynebacteriales bacterium]|nr:penicillin-binding protein 2 [Mycobacteriales bacterium]